MGCTAVDVTNTQSHDVNAMDTDMDMDLGDLGTITMASGEHGFVMRAAQGMTAAEAVEAIAEAAELRGITPTSDLMTLSHATVGVSPSPSRMSPSSGGTTSPSGRIHQQDQDQDQDREGKESEVEEQAHAATAASYRSMTMTPPRNSSPSRTAAGATAATAAASAGSSSRSRVSEGVVIWSFCFPVWVSSNPLRRLLLSFSAASISSASGIVGHRLHVSCFLFHWLHHGVA